MNRNDVKTGFTLIELMIVSAFAALLVIFFFTEKANVSAMQRDEARKTAINAMYYALEEWYYPTNGYYPSVIDENVITVIDPQLFTDPRGLNLGMDGSNYSYEPANCDEKNHCKEFTIRSTMEKEDTYTRRGKK